MSTLLNYGFTSTSKTPKKVETTQEHKEEALYPPPALVPARLPKTALPPIPHIAPLSIPHLERRTSKRPSRSVSSVRPDRTSPAPERWPKTPPLPPIPLPVTEEPDEEFFAGADSPPDLCSATLFPSRPPVAPPKPPAAPLRPLIAPLRPLVAPSWPPIAPPRRPSIGHHGSSKRIKAILQSKQIGGLTVPSNQRNGSTHSARSNSISATPVSAYAGHDLSKPALSLQTNVAQVPAPWEKEMALTPIEMDLGALEAIANLPETARPTRNRSFAMGTLRKTIIRRDTMKSGKSGVTVELPSGSIMTVITPESSAWQRAPYIPGRIRLEPKNRRGRSPLAIIQETVDAELGRDTENIAAEKVIIDELVCFIDSFGDDFKVEETGFDAFWTERPLRPPTIQISRALFSPLSVTSTLVQSPPATGVPRLSQGDSKGTQGEFLNKYGDLDEPEFIRDPPSADFRRSSFASSHNSGSSRGLLSSLLPTHSPSPVKYGQHSPGFSPGTRASSPRKVRRVKDKSSSSTGQKISLRGLLRSAASIV